MVSYLQDTNTLEVYDGSAWVGATGDITGLTAGTGISISSATGPVPTVTNSMATEITAKGDLIVGTGSATFDNLAAGSNGETLVADSSATTGLRWQGDYAAGKNKIINGNMVIDQRNAGAAVTVNQTPAVFSVDRWFGSGVPTDGVFTLQQDSSAPSGFTKSIKATITTIDTSIPLTGGYNLVQRVEGFNIGDLGYGAAGAKTTTLSFWVRSSVTGTFGGSLRNESVNRSYAFTYSISVADTWEQKSITIVGDTSGTWGTTNGVGIILTFALGSGADRLGTAGAWAGASYNGATGQTQLIGTLNATWFITGVQFEVGSVATAFQTATGTIQGELSAAQRYYYRQTIPTAAFAGMCAAGWVFSTTRATFAYHLPVPMRVAPTALDQANIAANRATTDTRYSSGTWALGGTNGTNNQVVEVFYTHGSAVFTQGDLVFIQSNNASNQFIGFSAEL
jgi:hypothetical protein